MERKLRGLHAVGGGGDDGAVKGEGGSGVELVGVRWDEQGLPLILYADQLFVRTKSDGTCLITFGQSHGPYKLTGKGELTIRPVSRLVVTMSTLDSFIEVLQDVRRKALKGEGA